MFGQRYLYCGIESVAETMPAIVEAGLGIELVFDDTTNIWPQIRWENLLEDVDLIHEAGIAAAVQISLQMLMSGLEFARAVRSPHLVMHSGYVPQYSPKARAKWMEQFCRSVEPLLERAADLEVRIALENTYERDTSLFAEIFERIPNPALGMCLDTGHATCFSQVDSVEWPRRFAERISHVHCSDNDGQDDLHWGLGKGGVKFAELLHPLRSVGAFATVTFEVGPGDALSARDYFDEVIRTL